jgi:hypothetical protein
MIKNILYSIITHSLLILLIIVNFKSQPIIESYTQQTSVGFSNSITASELSQAKLSKILEKERIDKSKISESLIEKKPEDNQEKNKVKQTQIDPKINPNIDKIEPKNKPEKITNNEKITESKITESKTSNSNIIDQSHKVENFVSDKLNNTKTIEQSGLSTKEKTNILSQLKMCYNRAISENKQKSSLGIIIKINISKDGFIESDLNSQIDLNRYHNSNQQEYKKLIDNVIKALDLCSPLRNLPTDKYDIWKELILQFDP